MTARASTVEATLERFEPVIGLEVHVQLKTESKIFCGCPNAYGAPPNTNVCPVCLGFPGVLPVLNGRAVDLAVRAALALGCTVHERSIFARKHYFYPDLPKGYQISQYDRPLATEGSLEITLDDSTTKAIGITRVHLEEDAGKSTHGPGGTMVDFNRCGVPLIEIVSEPDLRSPREAYLYLTTLKQILQYVDVSDCDMEKGSLRCDANVSIRPVGEPALGTKTEVKNVNSFRYVEDALAFEIERQAGLFAAGKPIVHETLLWDSVKGEARPMRTKELSHDYRYFPEPDLEPLEVLAPRREALLATLPELPGSRARRFVERYGLPAYDADVLTGTRPMAEYFEAVAALFDDAKEVSNWVMGELLRLANDRGEEIALEPAPHPVPPAELAELLRLKSMGTVSGSAAKEVLVAMAETGRGPAEIVRERGLEQVSDADALAVEIDGVLADHPDEVAAYRGGKQGLLGFFVGQVMRRTQSKADPQVVNRLLRERLHGIALALLLVLGACGREEPDQPVADVLWSPSDTLTDAEIEAGRQDESWRDAPSVVGVPVQELGLDTIAVPERWGEISELPGAGEGIEAIQVPVAGTAAGPSVFYIQTLLDRARFSPGVLDGRWGKNTEKAVFWFQEQGGLPATGVVDSTTLARLFDHAGRPASYVREHVLGEDDLSGPFVALPQDVYRQARLRCLCYQSPSEKLAERFHSAPALLAELNPGIDLDHLTPGDPIRVPDIEPAAANGPEIARIVISGIGSYLHALDSEGRVLYHFPITLGSGYDPSPLGELEVVSIHANPWFYYQPRLLAGHDPSEPSTRLPPGPNNLVGNTWIKLSEPHYGIHGTREPETIGYATSSGCVRLTNWDAVFLRERIQPGVAVEFRDTRPVESEEPTGPAG